MSRYTLGWTALAVTAAALEAEALRSGQPGATASAHLRRLFATNKDCCAPLRRIRRALLLEALACLAAHLLTDEGWI